MLQHLNYILLDAARMGNKMNLAKEKNAQHDSLYRGGSEESLSGVAPYLFVFRKATDFANWFMEEGWGDAWGVFLKSSYPMQEL
ncbi:MAG TPA: DUF4123 domain-containing protein, partial [Flavipsychrobacter sp.]|nr:DUF4123 domain-containing protein [Flavipsychrobacter sp.]